MDFIITRVFVWQLACNVSQHKQRPGASIRKTHLIKVQQLLNGKQQRGLRAHKEQRLRANSSRRVTDNSSVCVFTLRPPVFSFMGVRKGSKIIWLVSMSTGDCLFPTEQRFQAELTSPQNDGTATQRHSQGGTSAERR